MTTARTGKRKPRRGRAGRGRQDQDGIRHEVSQPRAQRSEGGTGGGRVVATGTPEDLADGDESHTGTALRAIGLGSKRKKRRAKASQNGKNGSGKSAVASHFGNLGVHLVDADHAARWVVEPGRPALTQIAEHIA